MDLSRDFQSIRVISFVITLHSILLIDFESGSKIFSKELKGNSVCLAVWHVVTSNYIIHIITEYR
jgi:hypothetical protein